MMSERGGIRSSLEPFLLENGVAYTNDYNIGGGSYATVVPLSFRGLKCAGKKIQNILIENASPQEKEHMIDRFQEECQLLSRLRHPNIVQFVGVYFEDGSEFPLLVMEFLHCTLSECVDRYGVLPEQVGTGILDDVATGMCYLHGHRPPIVHRDLSANNVLLNSDMKAKISDLGVAETLNPMMGQMTMCPGTPAYMPPEAVQENPLYDTKLDCFSFGVMILHVLCGTWPYPSEPTRADSAGVLSEVKRREKYFNLIRVDHPLVELIHSCLDNNPSGRPDAIRILRKLRLVFSLSPSCKNKVELLNQTQALRSEKQGLVEHLEQLQEELRISEGHSKKIQTELTQSHTRQEQLKLSHSIDMEQVQCRTRELCTEVEGLKAVLRSKEKVIQAKTLDVSLDQTSDIHKEVIDDSLQQEITCKDALLAERDATIERMKDQVKALEDCLSSKHPHHPLHPQTSLHWRRCADIPKPLVLPQSIVIDDAVFLAAFDSCDVLRYETKSDQWSALPSCPVKCFGLGQLSGKVVTVGGKDGDGKLVSDVFAFEKESQQWEKSIPPMPTPRTWPTVITYKSNIAACGGCGGDRVVEVFNSETAQWCIAAPLPVACEYMQLANINDTCYLGGGGVYNPSRSIICVSLPSLFLPTNQQTSTQQQSVWTVLPDLLCGGSTLANMGGVLVFMGGEDSPSSPPIDAIHAYCPGTKAWLKVASLPQKCHSSTAELLPSGEVIILGGVIERASDSFKMCSKSVSAGILRVS